MGSDRSTLVKCTLGFAMALEVRMVSVVTILLVVTLVMGLTTPVWANVYASGLVKTGAMSFSYILNENADTSVQIQVWKVGGAMVYSQNLGAQTAGSHTWTWNGTGSESSQSYKVKVVAADDGHTRWTQISIDDTPTSFYYPMGVSVHKIQNSANFGKICISECRGGTTAFGRTTTSGIYVLNADGTQSGFATGGMDWNTSYWLESYKSCIGPDNHLYVADLLNDLAVEFSDDLSSVTQLIDATNKTADQYVGGIVVTGTGAARKVALVDTNLYDAARKGIIEYSIPAGQTATPGDIGTQIIPPSYFGYYYPQDVARDSAGDWYVCVSRYTAGQFPAISKFTNGAPPLTTAAWEVPRASYNGAFGMDTFDPKGWVAYGNCYDGYVYIFSQSDGAYFDGFLAGAGATIREIAFDAAGNLVTVDNNLEWARIWSPGDGANSFTTESYFTFDVVDLSPPTAPSGLAATGMSPSQIDLSWTGSTDSGGSALAGYIVYREGAESGRTASTTYSDNGLAQNTSYSYYVKAYDNAGNVSVASNTATSTTRPGNAPVFEDGFADLSGWTADIVADKSTRGVTWDTSYNHGTFTGAGNAVTLVGGGTTPGTNGCWSYKSFPRPFAAGRYEVWFYDTSASNNSRQGVSLRGYQGTSLAFSVYIGTYSGTAYGKYCVGVYPGSGAWAWTATAARSIGWHKLTIEFLPYTGSNDMKFYVDDSLQYTTNRPATTNTYGISKTYLGHNYNVNQSGWFDDLAFYADPPLAPTITAPIALGTTSIQWNYTDNSNNEAGFDLHDAAQTQKGTAEMNTGYISESELVANTRYTRHVHGYNGILDSPPTASATRWTLSVPPTAATVSCDQPIGCNSSPHLAFTAVGGFTAGTVAYYRYVWDTNPTHTWSDSEEIWNSGDLVLDTPSTGNCYLHVKGYNGEDVPNGVLDLGPYCHQATEVIVDDVDAGATSTGSWTAATLPGGYNNTYKFAYNDVASITATYTWTPSLPTAGLYDVYCWYVSGANRTAGADYTVNYSGGSASRTINQTLTGAQWVLLASGLPFATGTSGHVTLDNATGETTGFTVLVADAIKWVYVGATDTTPPNTSLTSGPAEGATVCALPISFGWTGSDDLTQTAGLQYSWRLDGGDWSAWASSTTQSLSGIADGTHLFEVKARDTSGNEDQSPAMVHFMLNAAAPTVLAVQVIPAVNSAVISWTTDKQCDSQVDYGPTSSYGLSTPVIGQLVTSHSVTLSSLSPGTTYHYRVRSRSSCSVEAASIDQAFTTLYDTTPPETAIVSGPAEGTVLCQGSTTLTYTGSDNVTPTGSLVYRWRLDSGAWSASSATITQTLTGLTDGQHWFEVSAQDASGSSDPTPAMRTFNVDSTAPLLSSIVAQPTATAATILWTTDDSATSQVEYGPTSAYGSSSAVVTQLVTNHSLTVSGLIPNTAYHYRVRSSNGCAETLSADGAFSTHVESVVPNTQILSGPQNGQSVCSTSASYTWTGSDSGSGNSGLTYSWRLDSVSWSAVTPGTSVALSGLAPGLHTFEVRASDTSGNTDPTPALAAFRVDTDAPTSSDVSVNVSAGSATVNWSTSKSADARVEYGTSTSYGLWSLLDSRTTTSHAVMLVGLAPNSVYHYRIHSRDVCGRDLVSEPDRSFDTGQDTVPPDTSIADGPVEGSTTCPTGVAFAFTGTDDFTLPAQLSFKYRLDSGEWQGPISDHSVALPALSHGGHKFEVVAQDGSGNIDPTPAARNYYVDATDPVISSVRAEQVGTVTAAVKWNTDDPTTSQVEYKRLPDGNLQQTQLYSQYAQGHAVGLIGLTPDSDYQYRVRSKDHCNREAVSEFSTLHTLADAEAPDTAITSGPRNGGAVKPGSVTFKWTGVDNATPTERLKYQYRIDGGGWTLDPADSATTHTFGGMTTGSHVFEVRAVDEVGHNDQSPARCEFSIDETAPTVGNPTISEVTYISATVSWSTNEPSTGVVEYALADGDYKFSYTDYSLKTSHSMGIGPLGSNTPYKVRVRVSDEAGNESLSSEVTFTSGKLCDVAVLSQDLGFSSSVPAAGESFALSAKVRNLGDLPASATVVFYDWAQQTGNTEISRQTVTDLPAHSDLDVSSAEWNVQPEGSHTPWVQLVSVSPTDNIPANNSVGKNLTVGPPPYRLALSVSNAKCWVGGDGLFTVLIKNTGSRGQLITDAQIAGVSWVARVSGLPTTELQPGQEAQITFQMNVPASETGGSVGAPVLKPVTLQIAGTENYAQEFSIELYQAPLADVSVTVIDGVSGSPITNAVIAIGSSQQQWYTDSQGKVTFSCTVGSQGVYAVAQDHLPEMVNLDIAQGSNPVVIRLQPGKPLEVREVAVTPLTPDEIRDRGVSLSDPTNYWVYDFTVYTNFAAIPVRNIVLPTNPTPGQRFSPGFIRPDPGPGWTGPSDIWIRPDFYWPTTDTTQRVETWIIVPGDIRILKQFWDATVYVRNNCREPFLIENVQAGLQIPNGISLPDLNGVPQEVTKSLGTIQAQSEKQASWVVRGDAAGRYKVTGTAVGDLVLGGSSVRLESSLESPEFEVVQPKLDVLFVLPECVAKDQEFVLGINITNRSSIDLHGVSVNIHGDKLYNAQMASGESASKSIGSIAVGETKNLSFRFISQIDGTTNGQWSYATADPNIQPEVRVLPADAIRLTKTVGPDIAPPGSEVRYTITAHNGADVIANNINIEDVLPTGIEYTLNSASPYATYDPTTRTVRWTFSSMAVGATEQMSFRAVIAGGTPLCAEIGNVAERVTGCSRVPSNVCLLRIDEPGRPWLRLQNSADKSIAEFGDEVTYTLTVRNDSSVPATDVRLTDTIPEGCSYVAGSAIGSGQYDGNTKELSWALGTLAAGAPETVSFRIRLADSNASGQIANSAVAAPSSGCQAHAESVVAVAAARQSILLRSNLHVHTRASGGDHSKSQNAWDTLASAYGMGLDGIGFSDHDGISSSDWADLGQAANSYTESRAVVALRGFEWTWGWGTNILEASWCNHLNIFGTTNVTHASGGGPTSGELSPQLRTLYDWLLSRSDDPQNPGPCIYGTTPVAQFDHIQCGNGYHFGDFAGWSPDLDKIITLAEIGCGPSPAYKQAAQNEDIFVSALAAGWHVAPTVGIDNTSADELGVPWLGTELKQESRRRHTGVYVSGKDQLSLMDSLHHRRVFASEDSDFLMRYTANLAGAQYDMGSVISCSAGSSGRFTMVLSGSDSSDKITAIEIRTLGDPGTARGDKSGGDGPSEDLKWEFGSNGPHTFNYAVKVDYNAGDWFYVKVRIDKAFDSYAFSAPIWIESAPVNSAALAVRVLDASTGASLPAAKVLASWTGDTALARTTGIRLASATGAALLAADAAPDLPSVVEGNTLPDGTLQASGLAAGTYVVSASKPGYVQTAIQASAPVDGVTIIEVRLTPQSPTIGDSATYLDSSLPADGTVMLPLQSFTKSWSLRNSGTTAWNSNYKWTFVSGERMAADGDTSVGIDCPGTTPGTDWEVTANLKTPLEPGRYRGYWQMQTGDGTPFGPQCWVDIQVIDSTPPHSEWSLSPATPDGSDGWYVSPVTLAIAATSPDDPVSEIRYTLDGVNWITYTEPVILPPGEHKLTAMAMDSHNNPEEPRDSVVVKISDPNGPSSPNPPDGTPDVSVSTVFGWTPAVGATTHDLYLWKAGASKPAVPTATGLWATFTPAGPLTNGVVYFWQVLAQRPGGSTAGPKWSFTTEKNEPADVKESPDGATVSVSGAIVTAIFPDCIYVESEDRTGGIRIDGLSGVSVGDRLSIHGTLATNTNMERYVLASSVERLGIGRVQPLGVGGRALGGSDDRYDQSSGAGQIGVKAWTWVKEGDNPRVHMLVDVHGTNNIGLLIKAWGKVISSQGQVFYVDDGSGFDEGDPEMPGLRVSIPEGTLAPAVGSYVSVTGVSSCYRSGDVVFRVLRVFRGEDVQIRQQ